MKLSETDQRFLAIYKSDCEKKKLDLDTYKNMFGRCEAELEGTSWADRDAAMVFTFILGIVAGAVAQHNL